MKTFAVILVTIFLAFPLAARGQGVPCGPEDPAPNLLKKHGCSRLCV